MRGRLRFIGIGAALALVPAVSVPVALAAGGTRHAPNAHHHSRAPIRTGSLYSGRGPRPGPSILYRSPVVAPVLTNAGIWHAKPILVSGATAYRKGEFLYQDWIYDDSGARETPDPNDPRSSGNLFSKPSGTYTYPTGKGYDNNAADLVEFRVKPTRRATAFRVTLNTLQKPLLTAFSIAIGGRPGHTFPFPYGANVSAPAQAFLTVHAGRVRHCQRKHGKKTCHSQSRLVGTLTHAKKGAKKFKGPAPQVRVDRLRHQITVWVPHSDWNPRRHTVRLAIGVGLWNSSKHRYLLPSQTASSSQPGGAGTASNPAAFFNVGPRRNRQEPMPVPTEGLRVVTDARWWRDAAQATALAQDNISPFYANVSFAKLWRRATDNSHIPRTGPFDRILSSHFQPGQGAQFANQCGLNGASNPSSCRPEYLSQLQPYAIYVPPGKPPPSGFGLTLLLHSLSANYNQYTASRNQSQFANRTVPSIVITPEARGPDQFYEGLGEADVYEVWNDVAHRYKLNPDYADITGYSMGGFGTFDMGAQFPDLFARAQPTVGEETKNNVLASFRNLPVQMWNVHGDELVNDSAFLKTAQKLQQLGYRVILHAHFPCVTTASQYCSPALMQHLELAINDWYAPAAAWLGNARVPRDPPHVTFVVDKSRDAPKYGVVADHAYWASGLTPRSSGSLGTFDALSHGFGLADPKASGVTNGLGVLNGGNLGPLHYQSEVQTWGPARHAKRSDAITITAKNIKTASIDVARAHVNCHVKLAITTDGPITVTLPGCGRVVHAK